MKNTISAKLLSAIKASGNEGMRFGELQDLAYALSHDGAKRPKAQRGWWCSALCGSGVYADGTPWRPGAVTGVLSWCKRNGQNKWVIDPSKDCKGVIFQERYGNKQYWQELRAFAHPILRAQFLERTSDFFRIVFSLLRSFKLRESSASFFLRIRQRSFDKEYSAVCCAISLSLFQSLRQSLFDRYCTEKMR